MQRFISTQRHKIQFRDVICQHQPYQHFKQPFPLKSRKEGGHFADLTEQNLEFVHCKLRHFKFWGQCERDSDLLPEVTEIKALYNSEFAYRVFVFTGVSTETCVPLLEITFFITKYKKIKKKQLATCHTGPFTHLQLHRIIKYCFICALDLHFEATARERERMRGKIKW